MKTSQKLSARAHKLIPPKKRILLVDDHPITRQGLASIINQQSGLVICGEAHDANTALELIKELNPDVAVVDISLPNMNGIELMKNIKIQFPNLPVLIMSMHDESLYAERAMRAGARGYIMKMEANEKILLAIDKVLSNEVFVSEKITDKILHSMVDQYSGQRKFTIDRLSDRELEVFRMLGNGYSTRQIAEKFHLSVKTVDCYRQNLKVKLNLESGAQMIQYAIQWVKSESLIQ